MGMVIVLILSAFMPLSSGAEELSEGSVPSEGEELSDGYVQLEEDELPGVVILEEDGNIVRYSGQDALTEGVKEVIGEGEDAPQAEANIPEGLLKSTQSKAASVAAVSENAAKSDDVISDVASDDAASEEEICSEMLDTTDLPSVYDPRVSGALPALRNQNPYGSCWSFGITAAMEMNLIRKGYADSSIDLSERHLLYYFYRKGMTSDPLKNTTGDYNEACGDTPENALYLNLGGNNLLTIWHLAGRCGPVAESVAPYAGLVADKTADGSGLLGIPNSTRKAYGMDEAYLSDGFILNIGTSYQSSSIRNKMKALIRTYGAIGTGYYAISSSSYDNPTNDCYYYYGSSSSTNHNIAIVGWDDTFSKSKFSTQPSSDGAWLVRNSYGEESSTKAQNGYFWISYQDKSLQGSGKYAVALDMVKTDLYDNLYQYDGNAEWRSFPEVISAAGSVFTAKAKGGETLRAIGVGNKNDNTYYRLEVYKDVTTDNPESGTLACSQTGMIEMGGYHTIPLSSPVSLTSGQRFGIVFRALTAQGASSTTTLYSACSGTRADANSGADTWRFVSDTTSDLSYYQKEAGGSWHRCSDMKVGYLDGSSSTTAFEEGTVSENRIDSIVRDDFTIRLKAYTENVDPNEVVGEFEDEIDNPSGGQGNDPQKTEPVSTDETVCQTLTLDRTASDISLGKGIQLVATALSKAGEAQSDVLWKSSDTSVATVTDYGYVTAKKAGKAVITATCDGVSATFTITVPPKATKFSKAKLTGKTIKGAKLKLTWKKVKDADGYIIWRSAGRKGTYKKFKTIKGNGTLSKKVKALYGKKPYCFKVSSYVKAKDGSMIISEPSAYVSAVSEAEDFSAKARTNKRVVLTWKKGKRVDGFKVYRSTEKNGGYQGVGSIRVSDVKGKNFKLTDVAPKKDKTYYYKIRSYKRIGGVKVWLPGKRISIKTSPLQELQ